VELSPETCRVKPLQRINAIVASCWNYFTTSDYMFRPLAGPSLGHKNVQVRRLTVY